MRGGLAAGKTTLTKGIAAGLGVAEEVTSPTFTLLNEYEGGLPFYHMDAYRLSGPEEFENLGTDEILYGTGVSVIEWSERVSDSLPEDANLIEIEILGGDSRSIRLSGPLEPSLP
jgi:tRNA threonylcarbamoyladenosine biosynthesis protein TsaE